jgi:glutamate-1-semialdehyde 2,1-aminomutase
MRRVLETYFTVESFIPVIELAKELEEGIGRLIVRHRVSWHVVRVGARVEFMCTPEKLRNGSEAAKVFQRPIDRAIHLYLLNRGLLVTPFHNMLLVAPATTGSDVEAFLDGLDGCMAELIGRP